jgi:hypothetical protein
MSCTWIYDSRSICIRSCKGHVFFGLDVTILSKEKQTIIIEQLHFSIRLTVDILHNWIVKFLSCFSARYSAFIPAMLEDKIFNFFLVYKFIQPFVLIHQCINQGEFMTVGIQIGLPSKNRPTTS